MVRADIAARTVASVTLAALTVLPAAAASPDEAMTARRGIELTAIGTPIDIAGKWPAISSPNESASVVEIYRGDVTNDTNRYGLLLFRRDGHGWSGQPKSLLTLASRDVANVPGLAQPTWSADSRSLWALVADANGVSQINRIDLNGARKAVSASPTGIVDYAFDITGRTLAYLERLPRTPMARQRAAYSGDIVGSQSVYALIEGKSEALDHRGYGGSLKVMVRAAGRTVRIPLPPEEWPIIGSGLSVSPDGRFIAIPVTMARRDVPRDWGRLALDPNWVWISGFRLFDRRAGSLSWLIRSPTSGGTQQSISWSVDDQHALITGVVDGGQVGGTRRRAVVMDVATGRIEASFPGSFSLERANARLLQVRLTRDDAPAQGFRVEAQDGSWALMPDTERGHRIELTQDFAHKPLLVDVDRDRGRRKQIYDPNPDLDMDALNPVREYRWTSGGHALLCGLYLPQTLRPGHRYPLIIQTHGWSPDRFWYDGVSSAGFAAQALASAGFIVAQVSEMPGVAGTPNEEPANATMFDDLIDALDRDGLVDVPHVGITGWSRTGFAVRYALAFGRHKYGAAILADSSSGGYFDYMLSPRQVQAGYEDIIGAPPFGIGLTAWAKRSPMFNFDRIDTPMRVLGFGPKILHQYENLAAAERLGKPLELVWLPTANHWPIHPSERMEAQQGAVDWYSFWLKGEGGATPAAREEDQRWAAMKAGRSPQGAAANGTPTVRLATTSAASTFQHPPAP